MRLSFFSAQSGCSGASSIAITDDIKKKVTNFIARGFSGTQKSTTLTLVISNKNYKISVNPLKAKNCLVVNIAGNAGNADNDHLSVLMTIVRKAINSKVAKQTSDSRRLSAISGLPLLQPLRGIEVKCFINNVEQSPISYLVPH